MKLQTLDEVERAIGGRPRLAQTKVRQSLYVTVQESERLRDLAEQRGLPISQLLRSIVKRYLDAH